MFQTPNQLIINIGCLPQHFWATFIMRELDLKLEICYNNLVKTYDHSAAYCVLPSRGA